METLPLEPPRAGEVLVQIRAVAAGYADVMIARGHYARVSTPPIVPGVEAAGIVVAVGTGVSTIAEGDRVAISPDGGAFASHVVTSARRVFPVPAGLDFEHAAVLPNGYGVALLSLKHKIALRAGETVAVRGGGGVAIAVIQVARYLGARVIATSRTPSRRDLAMSVGADMVVDSSAAGFAFAVLEANHGEAFDVVVDPVGTTFSEEVADALAWGGRLVVLGFAGGAPSAIPMTDILRRNLTIVGAPWTGYLDHDPELARSVVGELMDAAARGDIHAPPVRHFPLSRAADALAEIARGGASGRIVLIP